MGGVGLLDGVLDVAPVAVAGDGVASLLGAATPVAPAAAAAAVRRRRRLGVVHVHQRTSELQRKPSICFFKKMDSNCYLH